MLGPKNLYVSRKRLKLAERIQRYADRNHKGSFSDAIFELAAEALKTRFAQ